MKQELLPMAQIERLVLSALRSYHAHTDWPDIKQEGMLAAWKALEDQKGKGANPETVAWNAARWAAGDYLRKQRPTGFKRSGGEPATCSLESVVDQPAPRPARDLWDWGWVDRVELPKRYRRVFELHYRWGRTQANIAAAEGVDPSRIQQIVEACRERIRRSLGLTKQPTTHCLQCGVLLVAPDPRRRYCGQRCKQTVADRRRGHRARRTHAQA